MAYSEQFSTARDLKILSFFLFKLNSPRFPSAVLQTLHGYYQCLFYFEDYNLNIKKLTLLLNILFCWLTLVIILLLIVHLLISSFTPLYSIIKSYSNSYCFLFTFPDYYHCSLCIYRNIILIVSHLLNMFSKVCMFYLKHRLIYKSQHIDHSLVF